MYLITDLPEIVRPIPAPSTSGRFPKHGEPVYAVVEIEVPGDFKPVNADVVPGEGPSGFSVSLMTRFGSMYNHDHDSGVQKNRWACLALNGAMFFARNVTLDKRPDDPSAYPPGAMTGLTYDEAKEIQRMHNTERLKYARVPRTWTVALRPLAKLEGGAR